MMCVLAPLRLMVAWLGGLAPILCLVVILATIPGVSSLRAEPQASSLDSAARQQIEAVFADARTRLIAGDGAGLLSMVSRATLARVEAVHAASRTTLAPLTGLGPSEKLAVRTLRRFVPAAQLRRQRSPELVSQALGQHWLNPATVNEAGLGTITIAGQRASAPLLVNGKSALVRAEFFRDGGRWRIDLIPTLAATDGLLRLFAGISGQSEDEYVEKLVGRLRPR